MVKRQRGEEGYALLLALIVMLLVFTGLGLVCDALALRLKLAKAESDSIHLVALSDAAIAEALAGLSVTLGYPGAPPHAVGTGTVTSRVQQIDAQIYEIDATGSYDGQNRRVLAMVRVVAGGLQVISWRRANAS
jgi:hypothetical protein